MKTGIAAYSGPAWDAEVMPRVKAGELFDITLQLPPKKLLPHQAFVGVMIDVKTERLYECVGMVTAQNQNGFVNVRELPMEEVEALIPEGETLNIAVPVPEHIEKPKKV